MLDDQPTRLRTRTIVNVPYTQECNDVAMMLIQHHPADEYRRRTVDQFDQILADARADDSARVMALVVHPYIMGAPHRLKYLDLALEDIRGHDEAVFWTGEQVLDWYAAARPGAGRGGPMVPACPGGAGVGEPVASRSEAISHLPRDSSEPILPGCLTTGTAYVIRGITPR